MKRFICILLAGILACSVFASSVSAAEAESEIVIFCFEDGSYLTEFFTSFSGRASGSKSGNKGVTYYDSDGTAQWRAVLSGTFTYTGASATCTASSINVTIYDTDCYVVSKSATKSGNTATGNATVGEKVLGITVSRVPVTISLKCDANGNLS